MRDILLMGGGRSIRGVKLPVDIILMGQIAFKRAGARSFPPVVKSIIGPMTIIKKLRKTKISSIKFT